MQKMDGRKIHKAKRSSLTYQMKKLGATTTPIKKETVDEISPNMKVTLADSGIQETSPGDKPNKEAVKKCRQKKREEAKKNEELLNLLKEQNAIIYREMTLKKLEFERAKEAIFDSSPVLDFTFLTADNHLIEKYNFRI
jgi:hypothetical protein